MNLNILESRGYKFMTLETYYDVVIQYLDEQQEM